MNSGSSTLVAIIVSVLAGGAAGALVGSLSASAKDASPDNGRAAEHASSALTGAGPTGGAGSDALTREVAQLRTENAALLQRLERLEESLARDNSRVSLHPEANPPAGGLDIPENDRDLATDRPSAGEVQARERRQALQTERINARLVRVATDIGLSEFQVDELRKHLLEVDRKRQEITELGEREGNPEEMRASLLLLQNSSDETLSTILTAEQLEAYQAIEGKSGVSGQNPDVDRNSKGRRNRES